MKLRINSHELNIAEISDARDNPALRACSCGDGSCGAPSRACPEQSRRVQAELSSAAARGQSNSAFASETDLRRPYVPSRLRETLLRNFPQRDAEFEHGR